MPTPSSVFWRLLRWSLKSSTLCFSCAGLPVPTQPLLALPIPSFRTFLFFSAFSLSAHDDFYAFSLLIPHTPFQTEDHSPLARVTSWRAFPYFSPEPIILSPISGWPSGLICHTGSDRCGRSLGCPCLFDPSLLFSQRNSHSKNCLGTLTRKSLALRHNPPPHLAYQLPSYSKDPYSNYSFCSQEAAFYVQQAPKRFSAPFPFTHGGLLFGDRLSPSYLNSPPMSRPIDPDFHSPIARVMRSSCAFLRLLSLQFHTFLMTSLSFDASVPSLAGHPR